jgi:hypothetical protein
MTSVSHQRTADSTFWREEYQRICGHGLKLPWFPVTEKVLWVWKPCLGHIYIINNILKSGDIQ